MKIELGKFYKTRDGQKARIYATDGCGNYPIHGAVLSADGWLAAMWNSNGHFCNDVTIKDVDDLISEWCDSPIVNWSAMPAWCKYVAMDQSGDWFCYPDKPYINDHATSWFSADWYKIPKEYYPTFTGDWKDSLAKRNEK